MERKWWTLIVVCIGTFMLLLDVTIVNVALPKIASDLHASFSDIQWVVDAYALMLASVLLTAGVLADIFGRRLLFTIGLGWFALASLGCALSPSAQFLLFARGFQGIGGAIMFATSLSLLAQDFHGRERGTAFGAWGATIGAATAVGPLVGGVLTDGFGWSSIFYINVPIGIVTAFICWTRVRESRAPAGQRVDWIGTIAFTAALFFLVFAVIRGNSFGWGSTRIVAMLAGGVVLLVLFAVAELTQPQAMFDLRLFRNPTFTGAAITAFALSASLFAMFLYFTLYLQTILGFSPLGTGLRFLPITVLGFFVAYAAGNLTTRVPARLMLGGGLVFVGAGLLSMRGLSSSSAWTALLLGFLLCGFGMGVVNPALASTAIGVVPPQRSGMASGINSTFRQVGIATGIAGLGAIFQSGISSRLATHLAGTPLASQSSSLAKAISAGGAQQVLAKVPPGSRAQATLAVHSAFTGAMNELLLVGGIVALLGAAGGFLLVRSSDFVASHAAEPAPAAA
jgi:EmrB/QacA subfamily drug resistance transporter